MSRPSAAFLGRDGTIIRTPDEGVSDPAEVELLPRAPEAIARLNARAVPVVVVTNQSGIGAGLYTMEDFRAVQAEMQRQLAVRGCAVDAVYYCPHGPEERCGCRKPALGMYEEAVRRLGGVPLDAAIFVGDRRRDVLPALRTGGRGFLLRGGRPVPEEEVPAGCEVVQDLWEAVERTVGAEERR